MMIGRTGDQTEGEEPTRSCRTRRMRRGRRREMPRRKSATTLKTSPSPSSSLFPPCFLPFSSLFPPFLLPVSSPPPPCFLPSSSFPPLLLPSSSPSDGHTNHVILPPPFGSKRLVRPPPSVPTFSERRRRSGKKGEGEGKERRER